MDFITLRRDVYVDDVRAFYSNASNMFHGHASKIHFKSKFCGKSFEVNTSLILNLFGILEGSLVYQSWQFNFVKATQVIFEDDSVTYYVDSVS